VYQASIWVSAATLPGAANPSPEQYRCPFWTNMWYTVALERSIFDRLRPFSGCNYQQGTSCALSVEWFAYSTDIMTILHIVEHYWAGNVDFRTILIFQWM
jgi:hypothetical protein